MAEIFKFYIGSARVLKILAETIVVTSEMKRYSSTIARNLSKKQ